MLFESLEWITSLKEIVCIENRRESRLKTLGKPAFEEWAEEEEPTKETKNEQ